MVVILPPVRRHNQHRAKAGSKRPARLPHSVAESTEASRPPTAEKPFFCYLQSVRKVRILMAVPSVSNALTRSVSGCQVEPPSAEPNHSGDVYLIHQACNQVGETAAGKDSYHAE
jgi:hypothetical protein